MIVTDERERNKSQKKTGNKVTVVTLKDVEKIKELADAIHARGGKVVGTCVVCNPWLLDKLEPYCDALTIQYTVSAVALNNALNAQVDVISGDFAPTGKLSLTMVSDPAVIAHHRAGDRWCGAARSAPLPTTCPATIRISTSIPLSSPTSRAAATPTAMPTATTTAAASV